MTHKYTLHIVNVPDEITDSDLEEAFSQGFLIWAIRNNFLGIADKIKANAKETEHET